MAALLAAIVAAARSESRETDVENLTAEELQEQLRADTKVLAEIMYRWNAPGTRGLKRRLLDLTEGTDVKPENVEDFIRQVGTVAHGAHSANAAGGAGLATLEFLVGAGRLRGRKVI